MGNTLYNVVSSRQDNMSQSLKTLVSHQIGDLSITPSYDTTTKKVLIQLTPPTESNRKPIKLTLCIDTSYSMYDEAPIKNVDGTKESTGMCILDIVRACGCAIVEALSDGDELAIVKYTTEATIVM